MDKVLVISGPTASGKSALGLELARIYDGEIISGDSVQIYRELNIGSAKEDRQSREAIPHHLIDILSYKDKYSVHDFQSAGRKIIEEIYGRNRLPIVAGGTGLYIKALLYDYQFPSDSGKNETYEELDNETLYQLIKEKDEEAARKLHVNNRKRLIRTLQLLEVLPENKTVFLANQKQQPLYDVLIIGLSLPRTKLHQRINKRVERMFEEGLVNEVTELYQKDKKLFDYQALQAIGYREFRSYFQGEASLAEVKEEIKAHTRQFAKRQYTWFNNQLPVIWFDISRDFWQDDIKILVDQWVQ